MWILLAILGYVALLSLGILFVSGARMLEEPRSRRKDNAAGCSPELIPQAIAEKKQVGLVLPISGRRKSA